MIFASPFCKEIVINLCFLMTFFFFFCFLKLLDFSPLLMTGNELNPGDHLGGSEAQNHKLELRKVSCCKVLNTVES